MEEGRGRGRVTKMRVQSDFSKKAREVKKLRNLDDFIYGWPLGHFTFIVQFLQLT